MARYRAIRESEAKKDARRKPEIVSQDEALNRFERVRGVVTEVAVARRIPARLREDALAEMNLALWESCLVEELSLQAAYRVADNAVLVYLRRERRWEHRHELGEVDAKIAPSYGIEDEIVARATIRELSPEQQRVIRAVFTHGSEREAAQELGVSQKTVNRRRAEVRRNIPPR